MLYKDGEVLNLDHIAHVVRAKEKIKKKDYISVLKKSYNFLDKDQAASIVELVYKMLAAIENGERMTIAMRDFNPDGTRRFK